MLERTVDEEMLRKLEECIDTCQAAHQVCLETINYCLDKGEEMARPENIKILIDCAETAQVSANSMIRESIIHKHLCAVGSVAADRAIQAFEGFGDDSMIQRFLQMARQMEEACKGMAHSAREDRDFMGQAH